MIALARVRPGWVIAGAALAALAAWPAVVRREQNSQEVVPQAQYAAAPVKRDDLTRDADIAYLESRYKKNAQDFLIPRMLSSAYLQRYRERGDVGDILRAADAAKTSLAALPRKNLAGDMALASADLALHRFYDARRLYADAGRIEPGAPEIAFAQASVDMEIGDYAAAHALIDANTGKRASGEDAIVSRWDEVTGRLADARLRLARVVREADSSYDMPAERRAWGHFRTGELDYLAGDNAAAIAQERAALAIFPNDAFAWNALARVALADRQFAVARDAAEQAAALVPSPETLAILADADAASGDAAGARTAWAQFDAEERIGNALGLSDRLIAVALADHGRRPQDAYRIARRELRVRDDIYTQDTLAWCAARAGHWDVARRAVARALRFDTEDPRLHYHAGVIAAHDGDVAAARREFGRALALNARFSATQAADAQHYLDAHT